MQSNLEVLGCQNRAEPPCQSINNSHYALAERSATSAARVLEEQAKFPAIGKTHRDQEIKQSARQNLRLNQAQSNVLRAAQAYRTNSTRLDMPSLSKMRIK